MSQHHMHSGFFNLSTVEDQALKFSNFSLFLRKQQAASIMIAVGTTNMPNYSESATGEDGILKPEAAGPRQPSLSIRVTASR